MEHYNFVNYTVEHISTGVKKNEMRSKATCSTPCLTSKIVFKKRFIFVSQFLHNVIQILILAFLARPSSSLNTHLSFCRSLQLPISTQLRLQVCNWPRSPHVPIIARLVNYKPSDCACKLTFLVKDGAGI